MDAAKRAVLEFMARQGHNDTTVHERVLPAVYHEIISKTEHEEVVTAIDREVHQNHYHTSVQPVTDTDTLEEQHHANVLQLDERTFEHDDPEEVQLRLAAEQAKFRDELEHVEGERTHTAVPVVASEHIHHHVHETIQPVINKQTIEPHIIHTIVTIRETHHNASKHHHASALPAVSMAEFKKQGGVLAGREERYDSFDGEPRSVGGGVGNTGSSNVNQPTSAPNDPQVAINATAPGSQPPPSMQQRMPTIPVQRTPTLHITSQDTNQAGANTNTNMNADASFNNTDPANDRPPPALAMPSSSSIPHHGPGLLSLLPTHFAKSGAADARVGQQQQHPPTRGTRPTSANK